MRSGFLLVENQEYKEGIKVAIPSKWGLVSYGINITNYEMIDVAIPSKWGLVSYQALLFYISKQVRSSQSLLNEVWFPTAEVKEREERLLRVAIPSKWGLVSYWKRQGTAGVGTYQVAIPSKWGLVSYHQLDNNIVIQLDKSQSLLNEVWFPTYRKSKE